MSNEDKQLEAAAEKRKLLNDIYNMEYLIEEEKMNSEQIEAEYREKVKEKAEKEQKEKDKITKEQEKLIENLRKELSELEKKNSEMEIAVSEAQRRESSAQENLDFLKLEISEYSSSLQSNETTDQLQEQERQQRMEIETNDAQLAILSSEETATRESVNERVEKAGFRREKDLRDLKGARKGWEKDRDETQAALQTAQSVAESAGEEYRRATAELEGRRRMSPQGGRAAQESARRALAAELMFVDGWAGRTVEAVIEAELSLRDRLEEELKAILESAAQVKAFREKCYQRQKAQYDVASSQEWLGRLGAEIEAIGHN